jgi:hypothetical protein
MALGAKAEEGCRDCVSGKSLWSCYAQVSLLVASGTALPVLSIRRAGTWSPKPGRWLDQVASTFLGSSIPLALGGD